MRAPVLEVTIFGRHGCNLDVESELVLTERAREVDLDLVAVASFAPHHDLADEMGTVMTPLSGEEKRRVVRKLFLGLSQAQTAHLARLSVLLLRLGHW